MRRRWIRRRLTVSIQLASHTVLSLEITCLRYSTIPRSLFAFYDCLTSLSICLLNLVLNS